MLDRVGGERRGLRKYPGRTLVFKKWEWVMLNERKKNKRGLLYHHIYKEVRLQAELISGATS